MILQQLRQDAAYLVDLPPSMYDRKAVRWLVELDREGNAAWPPARLSGGENPRFPDEEKSFPELKERIAKTLAFVDAADDAALEAGLAREVTFPRGPSATATMTGEAYLTRFAIPNFYFHATTAYDILRENGFQIGKQDFLKGVFDA